MANSQIYHPFETHENVSEDEDSDEAPMCLLGLAGELLHYLGFNCRPAAPTQSERSGRDGSAQRWWAF